MHFITVGMHLEIDAGGELGPIITSQVADVRLERDHTTSPRRH